MPGYASLSEKAKKLPTELVKSQQPQSIFGVVSSVFFQPALGSKAYKDAKMIKLTAEALPFYKINKEQDLTSLFNASDIEREKYLILKGMYIFVWRDYDCTRQKVTNAVFLKLLQEHMEELTFSKLSQSDVVECYSGLIKFCQWVYDNRHTYDELQLLFDIFPSHMKVSIQSQLDAKVDDEEKLEQTVNSQFGIPGLIKNHLGFKLF